MSDNVENKGDTPIHPVWDVYYEYRTARFNVYYYERLHGSLQRLNFWIELILALSVPSIAGLWFWETTIGSIFWKVVAGLAALLAVIKPLVGLSDKIQQNSEVLTKWRVLHGDFQKLTYSISQLRKYDEKMKEHFLKLLETKATIKEPPEAANDRLVKICFEKVNKELPMNNFFVPED
ncbi:MAG: hypothetical protein ABR958_02575 [Dehalococcoidales bacterium]